MTLMLDAIRRSARIDPADAHDIACMCEHKDAGRSGIHVASTDEEILAYTSQQEPGVARREAAHSAFIPEPSVTRDRGDRR